MIVSVITSPDKFTSEIPVVISLFKSGLPVLHLRKSKFSTKKLKEYIELIQYKNEERKQIILHSLKDTLNKMIAYKREIKINKIL